MEGSGLAAGRLHRAVDPLAVNLQRVQHDGVEQTPTTCARAGKLSACGMDWGMLIDRIRRAPNWIGAALCFASSCPERAAVNAHTAGNKSGMALFWSCSARGTRTGTR
ncbi:MAG: hypothetical protein AMXMBFR33_73460 [Candidatus Xenobia bacterium]